MLSYKYIKYVRKKDRIFNNNHPAFGKTY